MEDKPLWIPGRAWQRWSITSYHSILLGSCRPASPAACEAASVIGLAIIHANVFLGNKLHKRRSSDLCRDGNEAKEAKWWMCVLLSFKSLNRAILSRLVLIVRFQLNSVTAWNITAFMAFLYPRQLICFCCFEALRPHQNSSSSGLVFHLLATRVKWRSTESANSRNPRMHDTHVESFFMPVWFMVIRLQRSLLNTLLSPLSVFLDQKCIFSENNNSSKPKRMAQSNEITYHYKWLHLHWLQSCSPGPGTLHYWITSVEPVGGHYHQQAFLGSLRFFLSVSLCAQGKVVNQEEECVSLWAFFKLWTFSIAYTHIILYCILEKENVGYLEL